MQNNQKMFNVPSSVLTVIAIMIIVHVVRLLLPTDTDTWLINAMAFNPGRYVSTYAHLIPGGQIAALTSFISHMFVHGDDMHLMFNAAWFLGCGGVIALRVGTMRFLLFTAATGIAGALAFLIHNFGLPIPVVGASGAISGLMAGLLRFLFSAIDQGDVAALRYAPKSVRLMPLLNALQDRRIIAVIAIWMGFNALAAFGGSGAQDTAAIAWEAHVGGFVAGFLLFGYFDLPRKNKLRIVH